MSHDFDVIGGAPAPRPPKIKPSLPPPEPRGAPDRLTAPPPVSVGG